MGGKGSGSYYRLNKQCCLSDLLSIDWRQMRRNGWIKESLIHTLVWRLNGKELGSIKYTVVNQSITLYYRIKSCYSTEWSEVKQKIKITSTACNLGGSRTWLQCPNCESRVLLLYLCDSFVCRKCSGLKHKSVNESHLDRLERRVKKYQSKLCTAINLSPLQNIADLPKPRGMSTMKFSKLRRTGIEIQEQYKILLAQRYGDLVWHL